MDDLQLYGLPEAGRLLLQDPGWLRRRAAGRLIPSTERDGVLKLPAAWVEAAAGTRPVDPESTRIYWLERLAPPSAGAHRARRPRARLPAEELLGTAEAAARLCADARALERMHLGGRLPALRVDGQPVYDAVLVDLLAEAAEGAALAEVVAARTAEVRAWARFEYATEVAAAPPPATDAPTEPDGAPTPPDPAPAPGAYVIPEEVAESLPPAEGPRLIEADGFETIEED